MILERFAVANGASIICLGGRAYPANAMFKIKVDVTKSGYFAATDYFNFSSAHNGRIVIRRAQQAPVYSGGSVSSSGPSTTGSKAVNACVNTWPYRQAWDDFATGCTR